MKVGDYVRTKEDGYINKIEELYDDYVYVIGKSLFGETIKINKSEIVKSNPNIIDLIEVGDYVNGELVQDIIRYEDDEFIHTGFEHYRKEEIKSIVTKEQFESILYKVGE